MIYWRGDMQPRMQLVDIGDVEANIVQLGPAVKEEFSNGVGQLVALVPVNITTPNLTDLKARKQPAKETMAKLPNTNLTFFIKLLY